MVGARVRARREGGQATIELLGGAAALLVLGLLAFQLLAAGYAAVMSDNAAEAAALAVANGKPAEAAALDAVPGWPHRALRVKRHGGEVEVALSAPSPLRILRDRLTFKSTAAVQLPGG